MSVELKPRRGEACDVAIVAVAGGRGLRAGEGLPKQYRMIAGRTVLEHGLLALHRALPDAPIQPVIHADDEALYQAAIARLPASISLLPPCFGGNSRQDSAAHGLEALDQYSKSINIVLIHDIARIFTSDTLIHKCIADARRHGVATPAVAIADSLRRQDAAKILHVRSLWIVQGCMRCRPRRRSHFH
jgi:2-C-methyl-D-erythritol 4-phosphate cytidylyltransferase / 2-C-methyl-D-erythritol 2,4-cyclodiphosphate synthase